ncbi:helix-turn-helix transcriptional regulator [Brachybacterium sp. J153]|uniref:helix-turn-helix transcriptional regulator n=1 Tax=Brachybacterium sp. J153 TaxID=3116488 RepID=UPI002E7A2C5D|nr:helix-turn-helix transcriptional regulator [Brachybacterium sp. J153]MEE1619387.1 helix-turn-helix transcriptional regulator [Brachybacterium sp. J153]
MEGRAHEAGLEHHRIVGERITDHSLPSVRRRVAVVSTLLEVMEGRAPARPRGEDLRGAPSMRVSLLAAGEAAAGRVDEALSLLVRAEASAHSPLERISAVLGSVLIAQRYRGDAELVRHATRLADLLDGTSPRWLLAMTPQPVREATLATLLAAGQLEPHRVLRENYTLIPPRSEGTGLLLASPPQLTPRERQVLDLLVQTERRATIAERLFVSPNTVKTQLRSLYGKLGATNREQALSQAMAWGMLGSPPDDQPRSDSSTSTVPSW